MNILSVDLGKTSGIVAMRNSVLCPIICFRELLFTSLKAFKSEIETWIKNINPDIIICSYPTRFYRVIVFQSKLASILELVAEENNIQFLEVNDSSCKKLIIGSGKAKKPDIKIFYDKKFPELKIESEHILDAVLFGEFYIKSIKTL